MSSWEWERNNWSISLRRGEREVSERKLFWLSRDEGGLDSFVAAWMYPMMSPLYRRCDHDQVREALGLAAMGSDLR
jgi:hypothetical protein